MLTYSAKKILTDLHSTFKTLESKYGQPPHHDQLTTIELQLCEQHKDDIMQWFKSEKIALCYDIPLTVIDLGEHYTLKSAGMSMCPSSRDVEKILSDPRFHEDRVESSYCPHPFIQANLTALRAALGLLIYQEIVF